MKLEALNIAGNDGTLASGSTIDAYLTGALAVHRVVGDPKRWIVSHTASGHSITNGKSFRTRKQAFAFADSMNAELPWDRVTCPCSVAYDLGKDNIRNALSVSFAAAYAAN